MKHSKHHKNQIKRGVSGGYCKALCCCNKRLSVSSSSDETDHNFTSLSSLAHAMVQERLDQLIREKQQEESSKRRLKREQQGSTSRSDMRFVVMVAMEKCSYDPREDFRTSMMEMIAANRLREAKDLRKLLNYYISMNSEEYRAVILQVFHEVCSDLFLCCKCH